MYSFLSKLSLNSFLSIFCFLALSCDSNKGKELDDSNQQVQTNKNSQEDTSNQNNSTGKNNNQIESRITDEDEIISNEIDDYIKGNKKTSNINETFIDGLTSKQAKELHDGLKSSNKKIGKNSLDTKLYQKAFKHNETENDNSKTPKYFNLDNSNYEITKIGKVTIYDRKPDREEQHKSSNPTLTLFDTKKIDISKAKQPLILSLKWGDTTGALTFYKKSKTKWEKKAKNQFVTPKGPSVDTILLPRVNSSDEEGENILNWLFNKGLKKDSSYNKIKTTHGQGVGYHEITLRKITEKADIIIVSKGMINSLKVNQENFKKGLKNYKGTKEKIFIFASSVTAAKIYNYYVLKVKRVGYFHHNTC